MTRPRRWSPGRRYRIADGVAHRRIEGQTLLLGAASPHLQTLNPAGEFIWARIALGRDRASIVRTFQRAFAVSREVAERDVTAFLRTLEEQRLIRRV